MGLSDSNTDKYDDNDEDELKPLWDDTSLDDHRGQQNRMDSPTIEKYERNSDLVYPSSIGAPKFDEDLEDNRLDSGIRLHDLSKSARTSIDSLNSEYAGSVRGGPPSGTVLQGDSTFEIACITSFNFPFGAICCPMGIALLPLEAARLFPHNSPLWLGVLLGIVGITQLICPIAGKISDSHRSSMGKRRPFVHMGNLIAIISVSGLMYSSYYIVPWLYVFSLFVAMSSLNVSFSAAGGLVPDLLPVEIQGKSSGIVGAHQLAGAVSGFLFLMATHHYDHRLNYLFYVFLLTVCSALIQWKAREESSKFNDPVKHHLSDFVKAYKIDTSHGYDFLWVFNGRTLYYVAVSCQSFFLYYIRDLIHVEGEDNQKFHLGALGILGQFCGAMVAVPVGLMSDGEFGRKKLVYFACAIMSFVYISFIFIPKFSYPTNLTLMYLCMVIYGCGNGAFLSVDYAIALDCLPDKTQTAQALGIWGVSAFLGLALGPLLWGAILETSMIMYPPEKEGTYPAIGYYAMLVSGCAMVFLAGKCIEFIKAVR